MIHPAATDIIELLKQLVKLLQPFAQSNDIELAFDSKEKKLILLLRPDLVILDITSLICNIISYTPQGNTITLVPCVEEREFKIRVTNTGINLSLLSEITGSCKQPLKGKGNTELKQTQFEWSLPVGLPEEDQEKNFKDAE
ncbi:MAG TPA: hypothetical protein VFD56_13950 [Chitinophagaceae bacterium]|nr:hypothetical protein [Chitinophagaceae bacterium]